MKLKEFHKRFTFSTYNRGFIVCNIIVYFYLIHVAVQLLSLHWIRITSLRSLPVKMMMRIALVRDFILCFSCYEQR